ncbi:ABC transporter substrate-binding protein [Amycolatopsis sp. NPDC098790]|uniref:ABC transporter substrate-binding protein n=1 Tax=Amycolatopsis sp. NPDC098790 TaxID=3363939 RepID=UPI0038255396
MSPTALARRAPSRGRRPAPPVRPRSWAHRHWLILSVAGLVLISGLVIWQRPWEQCGPGLDYTADAGCVGLNLESGPFRDDDPLADLEALIADRNGQVAGDYETIVLLENMTSDPDTDSTPTEYVRHEIEGAIAAVWPGPGETPRFKLLLANIGGDAAHWRTVVDRILEHADGEHIAAVTGLGISLANVRDAVAALSAHDIVTIGATVTGDDLNFDAGQRPIRNFFRVGPTNSDEARAAVNYIAGLPKRRTMLVADVSDAEIYAATLARAFQAQDRVPVEFTKKYRLPPKLTGANRHEYLLKLFSGMHSDICAAQPDVIYFAGRGVDLRSFTTALAEDGACRQLPSVTVVSGDDAATLVGSPLRLDGDIAVRPLYTALAYRDQWQKFVGDEASLTYRTNYNDFENRFTRNKFPLTDLLDGAAMIEYDAAATAVKAAEENPARGHEGMANFVANIDCNSALPGATGFVAFRQEDGNQVDKALPILELRADGSTSPDALVWSQGRPLDTSPACRS